MKTESHNSNNTYSNNYEKMIRQKSNSLISFVHDPFFQPYSQCVSSQWIRQSSTHSTKGIKRRRKSKPRPSSSSSSSPSSSKTALARVQTRKPSAVAPLSTVLASPKLQKRLYDKFIDFRQSAQDAFKSHFESDGAFFALRERRRIEMDAKWWTWNLLLACTPGLLLFLICQYYKGEMEEFYLRQKMIERRKQGLEDDVHDALPLPLETTSGGNKKNMWGMQWRQSLWEDLVRLLGLKLPAEEGESLISGASNPNDNDNVDETMRPPLTEEHSKNIETQEGSQDERKYPLEYEQEPSIHVLLERIAALEARLDAQSEMIQKKKPTLPPSASYPSSIRERNEARLRELSEIEAMRPVEQPPGSLLEKFKTVSWSNLKSKGDSIVKSGQELLDDIQRILFHMEDNESSEVNASEVLNEELRDVHELTIKSTSSNTDGKANDHDSDDTRKEKMIIPNSLEEQRHQNLTKRWWNKLLIFSRRDESTYQPDN